MAATGSDGLGNTLSAFGSPINLSHVRSLAGLVLTGLVGSRFLEFQTAEFFFESFCDFVDGNLLMLDEGACLSSLLLQFRIGCSPDAFLEAGIWDTTAWRRLGDTISGKNSKAQLSDVHFEFQFGERLAQEQHSSAQSTLNGHASRTGPKLGNKIVYEFGL